MFKFRYGSECDNSKPCTSNKGQARIYSITKASKVYRDDLHVELEHQIEEDENVTVYFHMNCVLQYTSSTNTARHTLDHSVNDPPAKKFSRSHIFDFFSQCLYCGDKCDLSKDPKHPDRWRAAFICRSQCRSKTRHPTMNTSWQSVPATMMFGRMRYAAEWSAQYQTYTLPKRDIIETVCVDSFPKRLPTTAHEGQSQTVTINQIGP